MCHGRVRVRVVLGIRSVFAFVLVLSRTFRAKNLTSGFPVLTLGPQK